jgi:Flp pilus assembly pilin Flp
MGSINGLSEFLCRKISLFLRSTDGATSIEYAVIAAGIALVLIPAIKFGVALPLVARFEVLVLRLASP